ncbi:PQQ-binding-like beta-propeller repeat protein [Haloplanus pelagicus]|uniref:outer membrane protein assembly factor BamB family protein n=1 Tax=Haloplanus pelagicus TaxID=2949995 RepID=UPI002041E2BA|nr:PQQ-binding-like beta-propeller repeat protein [Haloplanus sp. HW8-1]
MAGVDAANSGRNPAATGPATGISERWSWDADTGSISRPPRGIHVGAVVDGTVYAGCGDAGVYALDAADGTVQWGFEPERSVYATPAVVGGTVYVGCQDDRLYALDAADGTRQWVYRMVDNVMSPTVADGTVYVGSQEGTLYALDAASGRERWTRDVGRVMTTTPAVADGTVFVGGLDGHVTALDAADGTDRWTYEAERRLSSPAVVDGTVFVGTGDERSDAGTVSALDAADGTERWVSETRGGILSSPAITDETVVVGSADTAVYALDATNGTERWSHETGDVVEASPVVVDGIAYVGSRDGTMYALTAADGTERWTYETERGIVTSPAVVDSTLYVGSGDNYVVALTGQPSTDARPSAAQLVLGPASDLVDREVGVLTGGVIATLSGLGVWRYRRARGRDGEGRPADPGDFDGLARPLSLDYDRIDRGDRLGSGGTADVYRGIVRRDDGDVPIALKTPRMSGTIHTERVERLLDEAETWARLADHDHIVGVIDWDVEPIPWIAMEYMDGGHLGARSGTLPFDQALWTAIAVTTAVRHAHRQGVAHLDLKPENVLFREVEDAWDVPKVADWGLSKHLLEHSQSVDGLSLPYAAPEQFDDEYGGTDELTDIYQLGAVLYELFAGRPPFEGQSAEIMHKTLTETPVPPSERDSALPAALDDVLLTALASEKSDRYESIIYFRDALQELDSSTSWGP